MTTENDAAAREAEQMAPEVLADILHALGRPDDPMRKTYRNYYCGTPEGHDTPLWRCTREAGEVCPEPFYSVTDYGREQAAKAMKAAAREEKMHSEKDMLHEISPLGGYAHGDYCCTCRKCSRPFIGDKRAIRCLPCAIRDHAEQARAEERAAKDFAYSERNQLVALLARLFPSGIARTDIPGWDAEWHGCVYIDLPASGPYPGLGGPDREFIMCRRKEPLKGQEIGRFRLSSIDEDLAINCDWYRHDAGYWVRQSHLPPPTGLLHRVVAERIWGAPLPDDMEVDHIDRDVNNITRSNLRLATSRANKHNRAPGTGVRQKPSGKWAAMMGDLNKYIHLGTFDTQEEANLAYLKAKNDLIKLLHDLNEYRYPPLQCSWHFHDSEAHLFDGLPPYEGVWDGHTTKEKYRRLIKLIEPDIRQRSEAPND